LIKKLLKGLKQKLYRGRKMFDFDERKRLHKTGLKQNKKTYDEEEVQFRNDFNAREIHVDDDYVKSRNIPQQEI
jgi:hypothetical protein